MESQKEYLAPRRQERQVRNSFFSDTLRPFPFAQASGNGPKLSAKEPLRLSAVGRISLNLLG